MCVFFVFVVVVGINGIWVHLGQEAFQKSTIIHGDIEGNCPFRELMVTIFSWNILLTVTYFSYVPITAASF